jgi:HEAT repeat protein
MFMKRSLINWKLISIIILLLLSVIAAALAGWFFLKEENPGASAAKPVKQTPKPPPQDLSFLLQRLEAPQPLTPEEIKEEARMDDEQVMRARKRLESPDPQQRLYGAEQLSAYPTPRAEKLLVKALLNDTEPQVRSAAAHSLDYFEHPRTKTLNALLFVLKDGNEEIGLDALNTLVAYFDREPYGSKRAMLIIKKLEQLVRSGQLQGRVQTSIERFLADQSLDEEK